VIAVGDETTCPLIDVITSPANKACGGSRPAGHDAGDQGTRSGTRPDRRRPKPGASTRSASIPRKAVAPMWTVADGWPEEIAWAIVSAFAIGMANAFVAELSCTTNCADAAVVHADHLALAVDQRAAGVARPDPGIGLDQSGEVLGTHPSRQKP